MIYTGKHFIKVCLIGGDVLEYENVEHFSWDDDYLVLEMEHYNAIFNGASIAYYEVWKQEETDG